MCVQVWTRTTIARINCHCVFKKRERGLLVILLVVVVVVAAVVVVVVVVAVTRKYISAYSIYTT